MSQNIYDDPAFLPDMPPSTVRSKGWKARPSGRPFSKCCRRYPVCASSISAAATAGFAAGPATRAPPGDGLDLSSRMLERAREMTGGEGIAIAAKIFRR
jgi:hypothetical protein